MAIAEQTIRLNDNDCCNVRYLRHDPTQRMVALQDLDDDQSVSDLELEFWERRLGIKLPRPPI